MLKDNKISVVIPAYTLNKDLEEMTMGCIASLRDQVDELIITEDGGIYSDEIRRSCDVYIYNRENNGFSVNVNKGWKQATGDYVMIISSDITLLSGNLNDLCVPGKVTSPIITNQGIDRLAGPFFVVPKEIMKERGMLLEQMHTYSSDSEYDHRVKDIFQKVKSIRVFHGQAKTVSAAGIEGGIQQQTDREIYQRLIEEGKAAH